MFLSRDELHELTGRQQAPAQIAWLRRNRWRYVPDADGKPKVDRGYYERRMRDPEAANTDAYEPNLAAINGRA